MIKIFNFMQASIASFEVSRLPPLTESDEQELTTRLDFELGQLLPMLGPLFGLIVLSFALWDYFIDPAQLLTTFSIRTACVLAGSLAYIETRLPWSPIQRFAWIYWTHVSAIIICTLVLNDGFLYGLTAITMCVFFISVVTLRVQTFLFVLSVPTLVFILLSAISMPMFSFLNSLMFYFLSIALAFASMMMIRSFRLRAFLLEKTLLHACRHDGLTGACNRQYMSELASREISLAKRHGRPLAAAMLDIDNFKHINDTYGHEIGDQAIQALVKTCSQALRASDYFARIGGEEFACLLPDADEAEALLCAERLRHAIEAIRIATPLGELKFTASFGVAMLSPGCADWNALLSRADAAMYTAKNAGRNQTVLARTDHDAAPFPIGVEQKYG